MSTNLSKLHREDLLNKIQQIRTFIASAEQDENAHNLLSYLDELVKEVKGKKYGLVFEEHREQIDEMLDSHLPVFSEQTDLFIDNDGEMNFLIEGDNLAALHLLEKTHKGKIDLIYIDPPYNTGAKNWKYNNDYVDDNDLYKHSKWLSLMNERLIIAKRLLTPNGCLVCAIDENEVASLKLLLDEIFGLKYKIDCITVIHNPGGIQGANFSYCHEYAIFVYPNVSYYINKEKKEDGLLQHLRDWGKENSKRKGSPNCFFPILVDEENNIVGFGDVPNDDFHPESANVVIDNITYIWPIDTNNVERRWRFARSSVETILSELVVKDIKGVKNIFRNKMFFTRKTVWTKEEYNANIYGTQLLSKIIGTKFDFPKSLYLVKDCISACEQNKNFIILDFFAGSGTTGHAVMKLNAEDGGQRKFILCTNNENNICREVTYERLKTVITGKRKDGSEYSEKYNTSLKYFKVDFVPISDKLYYEYADELLKHVKELVELENAINFDGNDEIAIILTEEELDKFTKKIPKTCKTIYLGHDVLPSETQEKLFKKNGITLNIIPNYYYSDLEG